VRNTASLEADRFNFENEEGKKQQTRRHITFTDETCRWGIETRDSGGAETEVYGLTCNRADTAAAATEVARGWRGLQPPTAFKLHEISLVSLVFLP
jgi:uncharacterized protein YxjI